MRRRRRLASAVSVAAILFMMSAAPAAAQPSEPSATQPVTHALGDAGTALAVARVLPASSVAGMLVPDYARQLATGSLLELGFGLSSARVDTESSLSWEHAVAQASPGGVSAQGTGPETPGTVAQTAPPDNAQPKDFGLTPPSTPMDALLRLGALSGSTQARWSDTLGPCVDPVAAATTALAGFSAFNAIPTLPGTNDLTGRLAESTLDPQGTAALTDALGKLPAPLARLGGLLGGPGGAKADGGGWLVNVPDTLSTESTVRLVDLPGSATKAVQATSTLRVGRLELLHGTPFALTVDVVSQPTLRVTATGNPGSSTVEYRAPVLEVRQGGQTLVRLDTDHPTFDIPVGVPLPDLTSQLPDQLKNLPLVGDLGNALPADSPLKPKAAELNKLRLDIGVLRLSIAGLQQQNQAMNQPFRGSQVSATARLLDLQVLPTQALGLPGLPAALAQVSLGEQVARAAAPEGGVACVPGTTPAATQDSTPLKLAYTSAYQAVPLFWTGAGMLFVGLVIVAALPPRPRHARRKDRVSPGTAR